MPKQNRETLKRFFGAGKLPSEEHFADLIDSALNIVDEGFSKTPKFGFEITPQNSSSNTENLISFFRKLTDEHPSWSLSYQERDESLQFIHTDALNNKPKTIFSVDMYGKVSISTPDMDTNSESGSEDETEPESYTDQIMLDVGGRIRAPARSGVALTPDSSIPADGVFHPISEKLLGVQALEVVAKIEHREEERFAIMHAVALNACNPRPKVLNFWNRARRIRIHQSYYSGPRDRLKLRWKPAGDDDNPGLYQLCMKSAFSFPEKVRIYYHVTRLWSQDWEVIDGAAVGGGDPG